MAVIEKIKNWYRGEYVPPEKNDPDSPIFFVSAGHYEQPPLAKAIGMIVSFYLSHWQWIIGTTLAIVGILLAL